MKKPEQIAEDMIPGDWEALLAGDARLIIARAINADRAQRENWNVMGRSGTGRNAPESFMGTYAYEHDAKIIADHWNRVNGDVCVYWVEED